jgi:hypothetical protein
VVDERRFDGRTPPNQPGIIADQVGRHHRQAVVNNPLIMSRRSLNRHRNISFIWMMADANFLQADT